MLFIILFVILAYIMYKFFYAPTCTASADGKELKCATGSCVGGKCVCLATLYPNGKCTEPEKEVIKN